MNNSVERARFNMIQQQVRPWNVLDDRVLEAMTTVPRERFVPDAYRSLAFADIEIPIGADGQTMLAPKVVGRLLQALAIQEGERVLEIGTGTGYVSACLADLGARVVSLEIDAKLAARARTVLDALQTRTVDVRVGDAMAGPVEDGPFDAIAVTGSLPEEGALAALQEQLNVGGRLFAIIGEAPVMEAVLVTRVAEKGYVRKGLFETCAPALVNVPEPAPFVF
jgi:protein-L-isoaspartate(D-aspartate) O-methyltransferase